MRYRKTEDLLDAFLEAWAENPCREKESHRVVFVTPDQEFFGGIVQDVLATAGRPVVHGYHFFYLDADDALCLVTAMPPEIVDTIREQAHERRVQELRSMPYSDYLQSLEWQLKRLEALERDGNACRLCGTTKRLQVHHRRYDNLGDEPLDDLTTLCANCHQTFHETGSLARPTS